jgi:hypothetical protein
MLRSPPWLGRPLWNICVTNDHGYVPLVVKTVLAATLYQGNPDRNHKLWNIVSSERDIHHMQVLLECCYIQMESSQWENWNHLFCRKVSFLTDPHSRIRGVGQGLKMSTIDISNKPCQFLVGWYSVGLIVHKQRYRPSDRNKNVDMDSIEHGVSLK